VGVQENTPVVGSMPAPAGAPTRLNVSMFAGRSASVAVAVNVTFLPPMAKGAAAGGGAFIQNFNLDFYKVYFYHTALIQALFSGMVAGVMGEGNFRSGFKHSIVLILISFLLFRFMV
jgi:flagellar protein FlaJ